MTKKEEYEVSGKKKLTAQQREEILIENFVGLQHAMTNLSIKFTGLSENINRLLQVFEESAKSFTVAETKNDDSDANKEVNQEMIKKIDSLLDQNKTIAQGLVIMEEKLRSRAEPAFSQNERLRPKPLPNL
ncbi:MAG: hypothetical protein Q8N88_02245 [Nanoarchaeota archaeon]|nr:hypothetical protein [Nanoarchaeota archaeon]